MIMELVNFATSKNLKVKSTMFLHREILNILGHLQTGKPIIILTIFWQTDRLETYNYIDHILADRQTGKPIIILTIFWQTDRLENP
jgi:hypothetical protein